MTIVLKRKINYHLLQTYLPSGIIMPIKVIVGLPPIKKQSQINDFETRQMRNLISCYFCCPVSDKEHSNIKYFSNSPIANLLRGPHVQEQEPQHNCLKQLASLLTVAFALHPRFMKCSRVPVYSSSNFLYTSQITIMSLHSSFHFKTICTINLKKEFRKTHSLWTTQTCTITLVMLVC